MDPTSGDVGVSWYDARNDPADVKTQFFAALSINGGLSFSRNAPVSAGASDATTPVAGSFGALYQYGDYTSLVFQAGVLYPIWADNSSELSSNPDLPNFDLAVDRAPTAHVTDLPLTAKALDISAAVKDEGGEFTADLATFRDADPNGQLGYYTATIDWGDPDPNTAPPIRPRARSRTVAAACSLSAVRTPTWWPTPTRSPSPSWTRADLLPPSLPQPSSPTRP